MEAIIMRAMAKNVDDRFADVMKMGDALLAILEGGQGSMATMPDMEAVDTDAVSRPNPARHFWGRSLVNMLLRNPAHKAIQP